MEILLNISKIFDNIFQRYQNRWGNLDEIDCTERLNEQFVATLKKVYQACEALNGFKIDIRKLKF